MHPAFCVLRVRRPTFLPVFFVGSASMVLISCPFATSAFPSRAVVRSVTAVLRQLLTCSLYLPPAAVAVATPTKSAMTTWLGGQEGGCLGRRTPGLTGKI